MRKLWLALLLIGALVIPANAEIIRKKNVSTYLAFPIMKNDGTLISGATSPDSEIDAWTDGAAPDGFTDCTNEATEIGSTGQYYLKLEQAETNYQHAIVQIKCATSGAVTQTLLIHFIVGTPENLATTDDGGTINVTGGAIDTVTTTTTATNLTNAASNGDFTATQKTSLNNATPTAGLSATAIDNIWDEAVTGHTTASSYGKLLTDNINATIGSRSSHSAADVWTNGTRTLTAGTNIALAKGTGITGFNDLDAAGIAGAVWNALTASYGTANTYGALLEAYLDAAISTRGTSTLTAADVWQTDISGYSTAGQAGTYLKGASAPAAATVAAAVWDLNMTGHTTSGTAGGLLNAAGSAGDPWSTLLPGSYGAGTAGYLFNKIKKNTDMIR